MCGLAGFITQKRTTLTKGQLQKRKQVIEALLIANEERGKDSTGVGVIRDGKASLFKQVMTATEFVKQPWLSRMVGNHCKILLGHTRHATHGEKTIANAHPFLIGSIVGAHNGTVSNYKELSDTDVDSQAIFTKLDTLANDYKSVIAQIEGTCTLSWVDLKQGDNVYFVAHENPLAMARVKGMDTIFWSSLRGHLRPVLQAVFGSNYEIWDLKQDYVYRILPKLQIKKESVTFGTIILKKKEEAPAPEEEKKTVHLLALPDSSSNKDDSLVNQIREHQRRHKHYSKLSYMAEMVDDAYEGARKLAGRQLSFLRDKVTLKDKAVFDGCDVCSSPIYKIGYYNQLDNGGLICIRCRQKPQYKEYGEEVNFS